MKSGFTNQVPRGLHCGLQNSTHSSFSMSAIMNMHNIRRLHEHAKHWELLII